jgi:hypothetical protein
MASRSNMGTGHRTGGKLEAAQQMAGHESARATGLYDHPNDSVALDEVERVVFRGEIEHAGQ